MQAWNPPSSNLLPNLQVLSSAAATGLPNDVDKASLAPSDGSAQDKFDLLHIADGIFLWNGVWVQALIYAVFHDVMRVVILSRVSTVCL